MDDEEEEEKEEEVAELEEGGHEEEEEDDDGAWLDAGLSRTLSSAVPHDDAPNTKDTKSITQPSIASQTVLSFTGRGGIVGAGAGRCKDSRHPILRMSRTRSKAFESFRFINSSCTGDSCRLSCSCSCVKHTTEQLNAFSLIYIGGDRQSTVECTGLTVKAAVEPVMSAARAIKCLFFIDRYVWYFFCTALLRILDRASQVQLRCLYERALESIVLSLSHSLSVKASVCAVPSSLISESNGSS